MADLGLYLGSMFAHWMETFGGVALLLFALYEKYRKKETPSRLFWVAALILLGVASFQAWKDEHHNSEVLISEKSDLWTHYNQCDKERALKSQLADTYIGIAGKQQDQLSAQQETFNRCVMALGAASISPRLNIAVNYVPAPVNATPGVPSKAWILVAAPNRDMHPANFKISCQGNFTVLSERFSAAAITEGKIMPRSSDHEYSFNLSSPVWRPFEPLIMFLASDGLGECKAQQT